MGCCFSTGVRHSSGSGEPSKSPPPSASEEETVKEVLMLETPNIASKVDERIKETPLVEDGPAAVIIADPPKKCNNEETVSEVVSEVSEMCSYTESFSNATAREKRLDDEDDDDGVVNQRPQPLRKRRAPPPGGKGRVVARRAAAAAPSPEKRGQVAPLRPVRGRSTAGQLPRNVGEENGRRRDPGEDSGRRLRSPVRREEVVERRNVNEEKRPTTAREPPDGVVATEEAESLENPVVSLECFIFL